MSGNVWVVAEHWRGAVSDVTFEVLALGREIADGLGVSLEAVLLGHGSGELAGELGAADAVIVVDDEALAEPIGETTSRVLAALAAEREPAAVLVPITNVSWDLLGLLPARTGGSLVNFCRDAEVADGAIRARSLMYGGKMDALVSPVAAPAILAVLPGIRPADAGRKPGDSPVEEVPAGDLGDLAVEFSAYVEPEPGDVDLTQQEVLIGVGRGIENDMNIEVAEELAQELGGAVCGSRPVIDQGWMPLARQVGKSGVTVKPRFYLAAGISGAPEHVEGMKDSELILAVNTDAEAPIFAAAHFGIVEDATEVLEAILEAVQERKG
jgi:electron transfer flavoprotein alpha subunit